MFRNSRNARLGLAALILSALANGQTLAQPSPTGASSVQIRNLPRRFASDQRQIWTSPFKKASYQSHTIKKYILPFILISGALIATDHRTGNVLPNTTDQAIWSGRVSQLGASYSLAGMSGATYLVGRLIGNDHAAETGLLALAALGHTQVVVLTVKQLTNRQRPLDSDGRGSFWEGGTSFPSGHAASSFALATVFAYEYRDHIAVPITAYSLAGIISASRISARRHWVSDIAVGGSLGFLIGRLTYKRNHDSRLPGSPVTRTGRLIPRFGVRGSSVALSWQL